MKIKGVNANPIELERWALDDLQKEIGIWCAETFPMATTLSNIEKLKEEVGELDEAARGKNHRELPLEAADCAIALLYIAYRQGFSLAEQIRKKHEVNKARKWGPPSARGVYSHLPEVQA